MTIPTSFIFIDDFDSDIGDDDINEELALPHVLAGISNAEKRELYRFKRAHNEVCFLFHQSQHSHCLYRNLILTIFYPYNFIVEGLGGGNSPQIRSAGQKD